MKGVRVVELLHRHCNCIVYIILLVLQLAIVRTWKSSPVTTLENLMPVFYGRRFYSKFVRIDEYLRGIVVVVLA